MEEGDGQEEEERAIGKGGFGREMEANWCIINREISQHEDSDQRFY
jgi:hypothetical protein